MHLISQKSVHSDSGPLLNSLVPAMLGPERFTVWKDSLPLTVGFSPSGFCLSHDPLKASQPSHDNSRPLLSPCAANKAVTFNLLCKILSYRRALHPAMSSSCLFSLALESKGCVLNILAKLLGHQFCVTSCKCWRREGRASPT